MSESQPSPAEGEQERKGKYSSPRDEVLHRMTIEGWANQSSGNTTASTGYFWRISNTEEELLEVTQAFSLDIAETGLEDNRQLLGHYLVVERSEKSVHVHEYGTEVEVKQAYELAETEYRQWLGEGGSGSVWFFIVFSWLFVFVANTSDSKSAGSAASVLGLVCGVAAMTISIREFIIEWRKRKN